MESTPHYFQLPSQYHDTAASIKRSLPGVKLIVLFRNPMDRYESAYIHHMLQGRLPYTPCISEVDGKHRLIDLGRYASILRYWQTMFEDIGLYFYDDIVLDPYLMFGNVMEFLKLENDVPRNALQFRANAKDLRLRRLDLNWPSMPNISSATRETLRKIYREEIIGLQELTGRDLSHWR